MQTNDKAALRRAVRSAFAGAAERNRQSLMICRHVLQWQTYRQAEVIGGYMPMVHEADVTPVLLDALACGKRLALPRCGKAPEMQFHLISSLDELVTGAWGLLEPRPDAPVIAPEEIALLLTPLEAVDHSGMRLGKGGGYYDAMLARTKAVSLGVTLTWQWADAVPAMPWDRPLSAAVDERGVHLFGLITNRKDRV